MAFRMEQKTCDAAFPRGKGGSVLPTDRFKLVYNKYSNTEPIAKDTTRVNFIFAHGTGMNKAVWHAHIEELYQRSKSSTNWKVGTVVSVDAATHGDSGYANRDKIAWGFDWRDGARDLVAVVRNEMDTCGVLVPSAYERNILVGHSLGGYIAAHAAYREPALFDLCIAVEPVIYYQKYYDEFFLRRIRKLGRILKDTFSTRAEAEKYFADSFYNVMEPRVLDAFVQEEIYEDNGQYKTKASAVAQMATYMYATVSIMPGQEVLKLMEVPFLHAVGDEAMWNSPDTIDFVRDSIPPHLYEFKSLKGDHLVHGSNVKDTVEMIWDFANRRAKFIADNRRDFPEVRYNYDRKLLLEEMTKVLYSGDVEESARYGVPKPPPEPKL